MQSHISRDSYLSSKELKTVTSTFYLITLLKNAPIVCTLVTKETAYVFQSILKTDELYLVQIMTQLDLISEGCGCGSLVPS